MTNFYLLELYYRSISTKYCLLHICTLCRELFKTFSSTGARIPANSTSCRRRRLWFCEQDLSTGFSSGIGLGDLDGDGDLDAFIAHGQLGLSEGGGLPNEV